MNKKMESTLPWYSRLKLNIKNGAKGWWKAVRSTPAERYATTVLDLQARIKAQQEAQLKALAVPTGVVEEKK